MIAEELNTKEKLLIPEELPIFPSDDTVLYPSMIIPLAISDETAAAPVSS